MKFYTKFHSLFFAKKLHVGVVAFCILTSIIFSNFASIANAAAGVPSIINFQGRLMDNSGDLLGGPSGTNYCYRFSIYSATTGGTKLWPAGTPSTMTILTREGVFDAPVGDVSAGGDSLTYDFQTSDTTFMNVEVNTTPGTCSGTWESLSPRPQIVSAAYAINSGTVQGLAPTQSASGNQLPQLTSDALVLGGTSAGVKSTSTNALTFNAGASGDVQFFSSANKITSGGALTIAGLMTSAGLTSSAPVNVTSQSATALTVARTGTNYALQVDTNTASSVTGLKVTSAAAGGGLAISVISSGTDENLTIDAKGAGSISIGGNSTGDVLLAGGAGATGCTIANSTGTLSCTVGITASAIRLDQITAATTSDTDNDNLNNNISWAWSTATTQTPLTLTANGSTTGSILSLTSSSAAATTGQKGLNVALTGALTGAQTTYGGYFSNTRTGASAVNVGLYATASGATGGNYAAIFDAGNVGIGTAAPQAQLEITGNFRLADQQTDTNASNGIIYKDGTPFIHNFRHATGGGARPNGNNTFVGLSAGNLTMGSTATVPYQASNNSGFGYQAFTSNTTGYYSSAFGFQALNSNTSGYSNSAFGMYALKLNDTGYSNSAMGIYALERNTSGYYNAALGYFAGGVIADGSTSNQTSNTSVYLGASTKALADGDSNEIVIGYNTTGFGSNTAAYGNSSITKHVFQTGEVMVGSTSDLGTYALQVTGNAYVTGQIDFGSTGTGQGSLYKSGTAAILASTGTLQLSAGSGNRVQILVDNGARRAFYTTDGKFLFGGGSGETYGGIGSDNGTGALVFYYDDSSNSPNEAARFSNAGLFSTVNNTITDTNSLFDLNLTLGNDATADTISALNIDVTSTATGADGDILYGINVANLTSADADVAESAIRVGTGWDNIFTSANASLTQAGALTVTSCTGCGGGGSTNWDTIGDPSASADINFGTTAQTITSTATTQNPLSLIGNNLTTGSLLTLTGDRSGDNDSGGLINSIATVNQSSGSTPTGNNIFLLTENQPTIANTASGIKSIINDFSDFNNNIFGFDNFISLDGTGAKNAYGIKTGIFSSGIVTTGTQNLIGIESLTTSTGLDGATSNVYGLLAGAGGTVTSGTINAYGVYINNETSSTAGTSTKYGLYVADQTGADTNYSAIFAGGNVGIGDITPDDLLNIHSATASAGLAITSLGTDTDPYIKFELADGTSSFIMGVDDSDADKFKISTTALGTNDRFVIDGSGNVTIGTLDTDLTAPTTSGTTRCVITDANGQLSFTTCGGGGTNWDTIGDPSAGADIAFGTTAQTITSTATTQNPLSLIGNSLTSGKLFSLTSTATAFTGNLANFTLSGSNAANTGSLVQVDNTGTSNANTSLLINHYATGTGNLAFRVNDVSGDTSPFVIDGNGNVGIGQASPNTQLHIGPGTDVSDVASTNLAVFQNNGSSSISVRDASSNSEGYLYSDAGGVSFGSVTSHAVQIGASGGSAIFIDVSNNVNIGGDTTPNSIFTVGGASEFQVDISGNTSLFGGADLRFIETGGGTDFVAFQAPASVATSVTWTLPNADSSGCLQSNGSGALSIASCGGGGVAWSAITNPTGDLNLTFDAGEETVFTTNATTATAFSIASSTLSSGTLLDLTVTGTAGISSQKALNISTSGAVTGSNSTYGAYISNTHTGASATSVGLYATASGGQTNYAAQFAGGIFQSGGFASFNIGSSVFGVASTTYPDYIFTINDGVIAIGDYNGPDLNNTYLLVDDTNSVISANASSGFVFGGSNFELYPTTTSGDGFYVSANTITTGKGITVQSSSLTSGALMDLTSTGTGALTGQKGLNISLSGANGTGAQTTYGAYLSNTKTGTSNNVGLYATASGGASNYAIDAGNAIRLSSATATESRIYSATGVGYFGVSETTAQANMYYNNNFITVATGSISLNTGGNEKVNIGTSATVINENSLDYDFRIEGDTDANLFFTDASTDRVAIGTNTPRNAFTLENNVGGTAIGSVTATAGDLSTEWNNISQFKIQNDRDLGGGNALAFFVSGTSNERKAFIQSGHSDGTNANNLGDLILNPFGGNIGIGGDLSPNALFSVGSTSQFQVNSSGAIAAATGITSSGTITFSGLGGAGTKCLQTDNSGVVTAAASACGSGGGLTVGTTAITSGGTNRVLYENGSNILSESADFTYDGTTLGVATSSTTASNKALNIAQTGGTTGTDYAGYFSNTGAATTNVGLYATASGGTTNLALNVDAGQTLLGGTTLSTGTLAKLNIVSTMSSNGSTTAIAGIHGDYTFNNGGTASFVQVGNRFVFNNAPTTNSNTMVGEVIRTVDNTSLANLVRGIEITSNAGSNTAGTNTGLRSTGATFGVQAITNGAAGGVSVPAGLYAENTGTTQGDVARFYTGSMTSAASMLSVYHDTSTFTGDALLMDMAVGSGTFSGDFVEFKNASVTKFKVTSAGVVSMGLSGTASTNALCSSLANATAPTAGTAYEIRDCNAAPAADYAEMYPVEEGAEFGDIVATGTEMVNTYDVTDGNVDWNKLKGTITRMVKTTQSYQSNVIGIVVDNYGDFSSVGHNIKEEDNPMPVALNGRVPVKIASDSDPIMPGDYITTSGTEPGKGQKAKKSGQVLGKALEVWTPGSGAQTVMVYVEQGFYNGIGVSQFAGIEATTPNFANQVLALLINTPPATVSVSEILTDRLVAGLEIITPKLYAQTIATDGLVSATGEKITISSPVEFVLPPVYNKDTAGYALIKQGDKRVRVTFAQSYVATPIVNVSMTFETEDDIDDDEAAILFSDDIRFIINSKDQTGFTILLNKSATRDIRFSWNALSVKDPTIFESLVEGLVIEPENNQNNENTPPAPSGEGGESGGSDQSPPDSGENPDSEVAPEDNGPSIDQLLDPEPQSSGDSTPPEEPSF